MKSEQPDEEQVKAFVLDFRHSIYKNEDMCVHRMHSICERRLIRQAVKQHLREARDGWPAMLGRACHTLTVNGRTRGPDDVADMWINGHYFHNDVDLRDELDAMNHLQQSLLWRQFLNYIGITRGYLIQVCEVVANGWTRGGLYSRATHQPGRLVREAWLQAERKADRPWHGSSCFAIASRP